MKPVSQLYVFHASWRGGHSEFWLETDDAAGEQRVHRQADIRRRSRGEGPRTCRTEVQPYRWDKKEWGERPERIEVCSPGCAACRHGYHNEVKGD